MSHKICVINKTTPSKKWLKMVTNLTCTQASLLFQLHSSHIGLNKHLHCIKHADSPSCPKCNNPIETIQHVLFECHHYCQKWYLIQRGLHRNAYKLAYLLSNPDVTLPLLKYIHTTHQFKQTFGTLHMHGWTTHPPHHPTKSCHPHCKTKSTQCHSHLTRLVTHLHRNWLVNVNIYKHNTNLYSLNPTHPVAP